MVKETFDAKFPALNNLQIEDGQLTRIMMMSLSAPLTIATTSQTPASPSEVSTKILKSLQDDQNMVVDQLISLSNSVVDLRKEVGEISTHLQGLKGEFKEMKELLLQLIGGKSSTAQSNADAVLGLEDWDVVAAVTKGKSAKGAKAPKATKDAKDDKALKEASMSHQEMMPEFLMD